MDRKDIMADINARLKDFDKLRKLQEDVDNGLYDDNPLIDLVLSYQWTISQLEEELKKKRW